MDISRRGFLTLTGSGLLGAVPTFREAVAREGATGTPLKLRGGKETTTICPYCGVGCGLVVTQRDGNVINVEGDPEHPVNEGTLCSKGAALYQIPNNERRLTKVLYRAPGSDHWEEKEWDWALPRIARRIKETRDATFRAEEDGRTVNRTDGIACLGGAALDNEECYLYSKLARALGVTYLEHQARI